MLGQRGRGGGGVRLQPWEGLTCVDAGGKGRGPEAVGLGAVNTVNATCAALHEHLKDGDYFPVSEPIVLWFPLRLTPPEARLPGFLWLSARPPSETDGTRGSGWHPHIQPS